MLLVSNIQSNKLNYGAQLLLLVFITVKPTSSYAVVFQSQKRVQYYLPALEIHSIKSFSKAEREYSIIFQLWKSIA